MSSPVDTFQRQIVLSQDPDAKYSPFGENATLQTTKKCPMRVFSSSPVDAFHIQIV